MSRKTENILATVAVVVAFVCEVVAVILNRPWHASVVTMAACITAAVAIWAVRRNGVAN